MEIPIIQKNSIRFDSIQLNLIQFNSISDGVSSLQMSWSSCDQRSTITKHPNQKNPLQVVNYLTKLNGSVCFEITTGKLLFCT